MDTSCRSRLWLCALGLMALTACATAPRVELSPTSAARVKRIALLRISEPPLSVQNEGGAAMAFGLIGALVQVAHNQGSTETYLGRATAARIAFAPELERALQAALVADGYEVMPLTAPPGAATGDAVDFGALRTEADAIFAISCKRWGYYSQVNSSDYEPWLLIRARLVEPGTGTPMYDKTFSGGYRAEIEGSVPVASAAEYRYPSYEALEAKFPHSIRGLRYTAARIVNQIRSDLQRR